MNYLDIYKLSTSLLKIAQSTGTSTTTSNDGVITSTVSDDIQNAIEGLKGQLLNSVTAILNGPKGELFPSGSFGIDLVVVGQKPQFKITASDRQDYPKAEAILNSSPTVAGLVSKALVAGNLNGGAGTPFRNIITF